MLTEELKESTRAVHAALEKKLVTHIRAVDTRDDYIRLLRLMFGYYHALEKNVLRKLSTENFPDIEDRRKASRILADLEFLAAPTSALQECDSVPHISSYAQAMGAMYVLEGSTLGGKIIAGLLQKQIKEDLSGGLSFFNCYGVESENMWKNFKQQLNQISDRDDKTQALKTAEETFIQFYHWIVTNESK